MDANGEGAPMISRWICLMLLLLPGSIRAHAGSGASVPGRYHLRVCRGPCTAGSLLAEGSLILLPAPLHDASGKAVHADALELANGCFVLATVRRRGRTMLGGPRRGYVAWSVDGQSGAVRFELVPDGVDAFYPVFLHASPQGMVGEGRSVYSNDPGPPLPADLVLAERREEADPSMCSANTPVSRTPSEIVPDALSPFFGAHDHE